MSYPGLSVDIFVEGPAPLPFEFPRAPSKIWRVPPLKYITNSPILRGPLGPQAKFHKGPIGFSGARGLYLRAPESPAITGGCWSTDAVMAQQSR